MSRSSHLPLLVALATLVLWVAGFSGFGGRDHLHEYTFFALAALSGNEAVLYASVAFVQVLFVGGLGVWLAARWGAEVERTLRALVVRRTMTIGVVASLAAALALGIAAAVVHFHTLTEDEKTYLFQSKLLLHGSLSAPVPPGGSAFWEPFLVGAGGRWSGQYFWAQPALLAIGMAAHALYVVPAIEVACTVVFAGLLAEELTEDRRVGILTAVLVATSPVVVMTGATLLNANLSAACAAVTLWALARLHRGASRFATWVLGLSTGLGLHNRVLDHAVILGASAVVLFVAHRGARAAMARRLLPAVAITLPFLVLHPLINTAVSGDWRHSGYWLSAQGHDWTTMGFGTGPGGFPQDGSIAAAKTLANGIRMAFYASGGPLVLAPLVAVFVAGRARRFVHAGAFLVALYFAAYFAYASASITTTGPIYFEALVPVLAACAASAVIDAHDAAKDHAAFVRLVPALVIAQLAAAFVFFWPSALLEVGRAARDSSACDDLAATLDSSRPALVFVVPADVYASWTFWQPMASPTLDDRILFTRAGADARDAQIVGLFGSGRDVYLAHCVAAPEPRIERYAPAAAAR